MADQKSLFIAVAEYPNIESAQMDMDAVQDAQKEKFIGKYDAAIVRKMPDGKVKVSQDHHESVTHRFGLGGAVVGGVVGALFPPSLLAGAAVGAGAGAILGHVQAGIPKKDMEELGRALTEGQVALVFAGEPTIERGIDSALKNEVKLVKKQTDADLDALQSAIEESETAEPAQPHAAS